MQYFLIGLFIALTGAWPDNANGQVPIDTVKLLDPRPDTSAENGPGIFRNCMLLNKQPYALSFQGKQLLARSEKEVYAQIKAYKKEIIQSKLYVFVDSSFAFSRIVGLIGHLKKAGIFDYKVVNFDNYFKPPGPVVVDTPAMRSVTMDAYDSTQFTIQMLEREYRVLLLDKSAAFKSLEELDLFINDNKSKIDKEKITIISEADSPSQMIKPVFEILKKHGFYKFRLVPK